MELVKEIGKVSGGYEALTIDDTEGGIGFTSGEIKPSSGDFSGKTCQEVFCSLETDDVRFTLDGTAPTSSIGHLLKSGESLTISHPRDIANFRAIKVTLDASLKVTYMFL